MDDNIKEIKDLFGKYRVMSKNSGRVEDERTTLIRYFVENLKKEPKVVAIRLSHYTLDMLYGLKSMYKERLNNNGKETADKWIWWMSRTKKLSTDGNEKQWK